MPSETWPQKPWNPVINCDWHQGLFLTGPVPVPGFAFHVGLSVIGASMASGENKFNEGVPKRVEVDGFSVPSRGNEIKILVIPHWNVAPFTPVQPNLLIPLLILGSSSKSLLAVNSVVGDQGALAVTLPIVKVLGTNLACADPQSMPTSQVVANWSTVVLGFTWGDAAAALLVFAYEMIKNRAENLLFGRIFRNVKPKGLLKRVVVDLLRNPHVALSLKQAAKVAPAVAKSTLENSAKYVYGKVVGGSVGDKKIGEFQLNDFLKNYALGVPTGDAWADKGGLGDRLGALVDGRSEVVKGTATPNDTFPASPSPTKPPDDKAAAGPSPTPTRR